MKELMLKDLNDIKIFLDPYRSKILKLLKDKDVPMTVKEIAVELEEVPSKVHYHVKKLEAIGVLEIKYTKEINGIIAKYYGYTADTISLALDNEDSEIKSLFEKEFVPYFDEAKQDFLSVMNSIGEPNEINDDAFLTRKTYSFKPEDIKKVLSELRAVAEKYSSKNEDAIDYKLFYSLTRVVK